MIVSVTVLNVATAGYQLVSQFSPDPNSTLATSSWYGRLPSFLVGSLTTTCQPVTIPVSSQFQTNNTALTYTLTGVYQNGSGGSDSLASLVYMANPLKECNISSININFESILNIPLAQQWDHGWLADLYAFLSCSVETQPMSLVEITANYKLIQDGASFLDPGMYDYKFRARSATTKASLLWGEFLLWNYYLWLLEALGSMERSKRYLVYQGNYVVTFDGPLSALWPIPMGHGAKFQYLAVNETSTESPTSASTSNYFLTNSTFNETKSLNNSVTKYSDYLSRIFYFTILTDLGQTLPADENLLTNIDLLSAYTSNFSKFNNAPTVFGLPQLPFNYANKSATGLGVNTSVIENNYLCQVPQMKSSGTLFMAVLVANFVLLQTIWTLFRLVVDIITSRTHPEMNYCTGCAAAAHHDNDDEVDTTDEELARPKRPSDTQQAVSSDLTLAEEASTRVNSGQRARSGSTNVSPKFHSVASRRQSVRPMVARETRRSRSGTYHSVGRNSSSISRSSEDSTGLLEI